MFIKVRNIGKPIQLGEVYLDTGEVKEVEYTPYVKQHMDNLRLVDENKFQEFIKRGEEMNKSDSLKVCGHFEVKLFDSEGNLKEERKTPNVMTNTGRDLLMQVAFDTAAGSNQFNYIAIGSGTSSASASDTTLGSEAARAQATYSHTDGQHAFQLQHTFGAGTGTGSISESGIFNASSSGQIFARQTFGTIVKGSSDSLQVTWTGSIT